MDDPGVHRYVCQRLKRYWSPDQIAGRSRRRVSRRAASGRFRGRRFIIGSTRGRKEERRAVAQLLAVRPAATKTPRRRGSICRTRCGSTAARRSSIRGAATAIGKETRSSDVAIAAVCCRWSNASRASRCLARVNDRRAATVRAAAEERLVALPDVAAAAPSRLTTARNSPSMSD